MARRRRRRLLVPEAREGMDQLQTRILSEKLGKDFQSKEEAKLELAKEFSIPLQPGANPTIKAEDAGKLGGEMGGQLVKEMIRISLDSLNKKQ